jgi:hypothetical protein
MFDRMLSMMYPAYMIYPETLALDGDPLMFGFSK